MDNKNFSGDRLPPQNIDAEVAVLGSMLLEEEAISKVVDMLKEGHFYKESHRKIYSCILQLYNVGKPVDLVTLQEALALEKNLEEVGGASYLTSLVASVPTAANIIHYAQIVRDKALLRKLIGVSTEIANKCYDDDENAERLVDVAEKMIFDIATRTIDINSCSLKEIIRNSIEVIDNLYQRRTAITGLATGLRDFDIQTAGLQPGDLIVIAGRPSMGKSALVTGMAAHVSIEEKMPVAFFSLEMSKQQLAQRILCSYARVDAHKVRTGFLSREDWDRIIKAANRLSETPLFIDDTPSLNILELRAKSRRLKAQHNIALIIVDYMQMMRGLIRSENRQQEIAEISQSLKALAKELNVPVIAVSQLSRSPERREDRRPQLADLRESGAIEQDADLVALLFREEFYTPTEENRGLTDLIIAKQRNGPIGTVKLTFLKEFTRFESYREQAEIEVSQGE
jgi:replicative DNA helicase